MYADSYTDEVMSHRETEAFEEGFQREGADDPRSDAEMADPWGTGLINTDVDEPDFIWKNPRIGERTDLENGRQVYTILCDDGQEVELKAMIVKLNKKLAKWDQTINILGEEEIIKEHWLRRNWVGREVTEQEREKGLQSRFETNLGGVARRGTVRQVLLTIDSPAVAGKKTKLIGAFEAAEDGESVYRHALNGATEADIEPFLARWKDCDHCGFKRDRRASFVCEAEDGTRVVIGRQCSRDFLGLDAAELLAREAIRKVLSNGGEEEEGGSWFGTRYIHVESLALKAYIVAKRLGGYSRDIRDTFKDHVAALEGAKDWGKGNTHYADLRQEYKDWLIKARPEPMDFMAFSDYVYKATGDFGQNLQIAFGCEYAKPKRRNLIIAGVGMFIGHALKDKQEESLKKALPPKFLNAEVGKRVTFEGVVEKTIPMRSDFGPKSLVKIVGDDGARCVHFCSGEIVPEAGERYSIKATIKAHEDKGYGPQTVLSRAVYTKPDTAQQKLI